MMYHAHSLEFVKVKAWIAGRSLREDVTREEIMTVVQFNSMITQAVSYEAKITTNVEFKTGKPQQEDYRSHYNTAKNPPKEFEIFNMEGFPIIKSFIKLFELNEPAKAKGNL